MINTKTKKFNKKKIESLITQLLKELDPNPEREGLKETPKRVAKYWAETMEGQLYTNDEIANMYDKCFEHITTDELVLEKDIEIFSHCEHHLALMYNMKVAIAYIPKGKVIGLSKMARISEMVGKRLQLQEKIGEDIAYIMKKILGTEDVAVVIEGQHGCMTARGAKSRNAVTRTACLGGEFRNSSSLRTELYSLLK